MNTGKAIFLNGVTSSGKTTISKAIQEIADEHFYHLSNDMFNSFYWAMFHDKYDKHIEESGRVYEYWAESIVLMYRFARMVVEQGKNIIIDGMLEERDVFIQCYQKTNYDLLLDAFEGLNLFMVEVFCPLDECRRRNIARGDRGEGQSDEQHTIMNRAVMYDCFVDTSVYDTNTCVRKILKELCKDE